MRLKAKIAVTVYGKSGEAISKADYLMEDLDIKHETKRIGPNRWRNTGHMMFAGYCPNHDELSNEGERFEAR